MFGTRERPFLHPPGRATLFAEIIGAHYHPPTLELTGGGQRMHKLLRVDMSKRTVAYEDLPKRYSQMGGRWLTSRIVADEVPPTCHALGPENVAVIAPGIVTGTPAPTSSRISVGAKSPLTGTIKESNSGAALSPKLARLGIRAVIIEGQAKPGEFSLLRISKDGASLSPAAPWTGMGLYEAFPALFDAHGGVQRVGIMAIGTAGEMRMASAGVAFNDLSGRPSRYAGRGGLGAVLGSKGLKFVVVDDTDAPKREIRNKDLFASGRAKLAHALATHAITKPKGALNAYGTAVLINIINEAGALPSHNFREGRFAGAAKIAGEAIFEGNKSRLGKEL